MTLAEYIDNQGVKKICKLYKVGKSTVYQWLSYRNVPQPLMSYNIVRKTKGLVTWREIYEPFVLIKRGRK